MPRVFVSYSHDSDAHRSWVLALVQRLRARGIDAWLDRFDPWPAQGWPRWMRTEVDRADFVLCVCTPMYRRRFEDGDPGRGVTWEGLLAELLTYEGDGPTWVPVLPPGGDAAAVPTILRAGTTHALDKDLDDLVARLLGRPDVVPSPLGDADVHPGMGDGPSLKDELAAALTVRETLGMAGASTDAVNTRIRALNAELRRGPTLANSALIYG